jgi:hypothetical protein
MRVLSILIRETKPRSYSMILRLRRATAVLKKRMCALFRWNITAPDLTPIHEQEELHNLDLSELYGENNRDRDKGSHLSSEHEGPSKF